MANDEETETTETETESQIIDVLPVAKVEDKKVEEPTLKMLDVFPNFKSLPDLNFFPD